MRAHDTTEATLMLFAAVFLLVGLGAGVEYLWQKNEQRRTEARMRRIIG